MSKWIHMKRFLCAFAFKWTMVLGLGMSVLHSEAQTYLRLSFSAGGAFGIVPFQAADSLISSLGYYAGPRGSFSYWNDLELFVQPSIRALSHADRFQDVKFRRTYGECIMGAEWSPSFLNQSSIELGVLGGGLLRSVIRDASANSSGNRNYVVVEEQYRHFAEPYLGLNLRLSDRSSLQAAFHYSFFKYPESRAINGRPSHMVLGMKFDLLDSRDKKPSGSDTDRVSGARSEILAFKQQGVLLVQRIPYQSRSEFGSDEAYLKMQARTDSANAWLENAFKSLYNFSAVKFFHQQEIEAVYARNWKETSIGFETGSEPPYFIALVGSYFYEHNRNVNSGIFIYDSKMQFKSLPFPGFSSFRSMAQYFYDREAMNSMVLWLNKALYRYEAATLPRNR